MTPSRWVWGLVAIVVIAMIAGRLDARPTSTPGGTPPARARTGAHAFACGHGTCDAAARYCETIQTDAPELPSDHACEPLPAACRATEGAPPSCDCFPPGTRCRFCSAVDAGGRIAFYRTCIGGA